MIKDPGCNGFFGREYNLDNAVIVEEGYDWLVVRLWDGTLEFANLDMDNLSKQRLINKWCSEIEEDD